MRNDGGDGGRQRQIAGRDLRDVRTRCRTCFSSVILERCRKPRRWSRARHRYTRPLVRIEPRSRAHPTYTLDVVARSPRLPAGPTPGRLPLPAVFLNMGDGAFDLEGPVL